MMAMTIGANDSRSRIDVLQLEKVPIEIEWQVSLPSEDVLARLLLELIGEDGLKEMLNA
jgi:hypothetical protein